jgi:hypothetical protein
VEGSMVFCTEQTPKLGPHAITWLPLSITY